MMMKIMTTQNAGWSGADSDDDEEDGVWMMRMLIKMMQYSS